MCEVGDVGALADNALVHLFGHGQHPREPACTASYRVLLIGGPKV